MYLGQMSTSGHCGARSEVGVGLSVDRVHCHCMHEWTQTGISWLLSFMMISLHSNSV